MSDLIADDIVNSVNILDDVRKPEPHLNWSLPRTQVVADGDIALEIRADDRAQKPAS